MKSNDIFGYGSGFSYFFFWGVESWRHAHNEARAQPYRFNKSLPAGR